MEQVERDAIASTQKDLTPQGGTIKRYLEFESALADASAWLQGLAPADRAAPACYVKSGSTPRDRFRAGSSTGCVPVVQPDWAFFDPSLPRSTLREPAGEAGHPGGVPRQPSAAPDPGQGGRARLVEVAGTSGAEPRLVEGARVCSSWRRVPVESARHSPP
jgi:hypothetical protein